MLPDALGTYALILNLPHPGKGISVGRLGRFYFSAGWYLYVGSARGPGGLAARLARHLRTSKSLHWHIDYLRAQAHPVEIWYATGKQEQECAWAQTLMTLDGAFVPVPRFGASDCRCLTHLIRFASLPDSMAFADALERSVAREVLDV